MTYIKWGNTAAVATIAGAMLAALIVAPAAPAATIKACQKKKGGALRIISGKQKCKSKTEKTLRWNTQGPAGTNGANGTNGTNGAGGAAGAPGATGPQGPGAKRFSGSTTIGILSDNQAVAPFTVGPVTISFNCGNFIVGNTATIKVTSTAAGAVATSGIRAENPDNSIDEPQPFFDSSSLGVGPTVTHNIALAGGDATTNPSTFTSVIDAGDSTVVVSGAVALASSCTIRGLAVLGTS